MAGHPALYDLFAHTQGLASSSAIPTAGSHLQNGQVTIASHNIAGGAAGFSSSSHGFSHAALAIRLALLKTALMCLQVRSWGCFFWNFQAGQEQ